MNFWNSWNRSWNLTGNDLLFVLKNPFYFYSPAFTRYFLVVIGRMGFAKAIGTLPAFMLKDQFDEVTFNFFVIISLFVVIISLFVAINSLFVVIISLVVVINSLLSILSHYLSLLSHYLSLLSHYLSILSHYLSILSHYLGDCSEMFTTITFQRIYFEHNVYATSFWCPFNVILLLLFYRIPNNICFVFISLWTVDFIGT